MTPYLSIFDCIVITITTVSLEGFLSLWLVQIEQEGMATSLIIVENSVDFEYF